MHLLGGQALLSQADRDAARRVVRAAVRRAWDTLREDDLRDPVIALIDHEGLGPWLAERVESDPRPRAISPSALASLTTARHRLSAQELGWSSEIQLLAPLFSKHFALIFKGMHLASEVYPAPATRPRADIDILIEPQHRAGIRRELEALGYRSPPAIDAPAVSIEEGYERAGVGGVPVALDVHFAFSNRPILRRALTIDRLRQTARPGAGILSGFRVPSRSDALQIACVHRIGHRPAERRWLWLLDVHYLWETMDAEARDRFAAGARERRIGAICADALARARVLFGTPVAPEQLERLRQAAAREPSAGLIDLPDAPLVRLRYDLASQEGLRARAAFLWQQAFPDAAYVRERFGTDRRGRARSLPLAYLVRLARGLRRRLGR